MNIKTFWLVHMVQKQGSPNYEKQSTLEKNLMSRIYNIWTCQFRMNLDEKSINKITDQSTSVHSVYHHLTLGKLKYLSSPKIMFHFQTFTKFCSFLFLKQDTIDPKRADRCRGGRETERIGPITNHSPTENC